MKNRGTPEKDFAFCFKAAFVARADSLTPPFIVAEQQITRTLLVMEFITQCLSDPLELLRFSFQDVHRLVSLEPQAMVQTAQEEIAFREQAVLAFLEDAVAGERT